MIHCKFILYNLFTILIGNQVIGRYKSDKNALVGFSTFSECIYLSDSFLGVVFINGKFRVVKFNFTQVDDVVVSVDQQIDLSSV